MDLEMVLVFVAMLIAAYFSPEPAPTIITRAELSIAPDESGGQISILPPVVRMHSRA